MIETEMAPVSERQSSRWRRLRRQHVPVFLLFLILSVALTYPLAFRLSDHVVNYGDPLLNTWILAWDIHALQTQPLHLFDANSFYPYENTLAYSENLLTTALLAAPWLWLTDNPVLAHNMLTLLSFAWGGFWAYLLVGRLTKSAFGGIVGGVVFAFAHYRLGQISHIQLLTSWWMPMALYFLERFLDERRNRDLVGFTAGFIAQAWATIYLGIFLAGAVLLYLLCHLVIDADLRQDRSFWARMGTAGLLIAIAIGTLYLPYSQARKVVGSRELAGQNGAALRDYLTAYPESLSGKLGALEPVRESPEHTLFPGFTCLTLTLWGVLKGGKNWRSTAFYLALGLISLVLSLGPQLHLTRDRPALLNGLPYAIAYRYLPFIRAIRVPARLSLLVMLALAVFTGFGATALARAVGQRRWICHGLVAAGLLLDYTGVPIPMIPIEIGPQVPPVYHWLDGQDPGSVIFEFPTADSPDITEDEVSIPRLSRHQYFSIYHWQRLTMGYSGFYPPLFWESLEHGLHFPSHESLAYFRGLGVDYVLIHDEELSNDERMHTHLGLTRRSAVLSEVGRYGETAVYRLRAEPSVEPDVDLHLPPTVQPNRPYYAYILVNLPKNEARVSEEPLAYRVAFEWRSADGKVTSDELHEQLPMVLGSGTTILPLALSKPADDPATLSVRFRGLSQAVEMTQIFTSHQEEATDLRAVADDLQRIDAPLGEGLTLTHVHFPGGRERTAGDPLSVVLTWRRLRSRNPALTAYIHILNSQGLKVAQVDTPLSFAPAFDRQVVLLPWDLPPGRYDIVTGVYDAQTQQDVGDPLELGSMRVRQPAALGRMVRGPSSFKVGDGLELLGYDLDPDTVQPGRETTLTLYWRCQETTEHSYKVFTHLLSQDGTILEQQDRQPRNGRHATSSWRPGEIVVDRYRLAVPRDAQPGPHPLAVGMYLPATGQRLSIRDADGSDLPGRRILLNGPEVGQGGEP